MNESASPAPLAASPLVATAERLRHALSAIILGQEAALDLALMTLFSGAHALIEGVPGTAKTLLVRALAAACASEFQRVQFTPDLMPADITGTNVFDLRAQEFRLLRGPVFTDFLLADEINRAPAKTQSALLQAMQERAVTIDRASYPLSPGFTVFATQNPIEFQGTYPLPEAQKDRFLVKIPMPYPALEAERALLDRAIAGAAPEPMLPQLLPTPVLSSEELARARAGLSAIRLGPEVAGYLLELVRATREHPALLLGAGPRATLAFERAVRAWALLRGRDYVIPEDVRDLARPVLEHRLLLRPEWELEGGSLAEVIVELLEKVEVPR